MTPWAEFREDSVNDRAFDAFVRKAGSSQNRRASLKALGAAAVVAAASSPLAAKAGKAGKKVRKKCRKQGVPCLAFAADMCDALLPDPEVAECIELFQPCCSSIQKCNGPAFFECVEERLLTILATA